MISNFQIRKDSSLPYLDINLTKDGRLTMYAQSSMTGCTDVVDPNMVDLTTATQVRFRLFKCGRTNQEVVLSGSSEILNAKSGGVRYKWDQSDTFTPGVFYGQFEVTWGAGEVFLWPLQKESLTIEII